MFWHASVLPSINLSVHRGGVPISHNALQHFPECHGADMGGYPYPIMLCNISQNAMGQTTGGVPISHNALQHYPEFHGADTRRGVPSQVQLGGTLPGQDGGYPTRRVSCWGYPGRVPPIRVPPTRSGQGVPIRVPPTRSGQRGTLAEYPPTGYPPSPGQVRMGGRVPS